MIDLHTHLWRHERGTPLPTYDELARVCERAASVGVDQLAITEHCHRFDEIEAIALPAWRRPVADVWDAYGDAVIELAASGSVDVIAHVDVIKVAGHRPPDRSAWEARIASALAERGVAVEVSSAGWRKPAAEPYPSISLLELLHAANVPFTTASDAHEVDQIGDPFGDLHNTLTAAGVDAVTTFERRTPRRRPVD